MSIEEKIALLAETIDAEKDELTPETILENLDCWDSMAKLSVIVMFEDECGKTITNNDIKAFVTVNDILQKM